ncbi:MAG: hypothetical protein KGS48_15260 [Bacteroidetes bacterium]|nr:hypothetical protein [Bacteroidota bacterium]
MRNYSEGPISDVVNGGPDLWIFGKEIKGKEVYIKITLGQPNNPTICISFHFSNFPMYYPFK